MTKRFELMPYRFYYHAWRGLALAEERLGHAQEAQSAWARVLALVPETPEAKREAEDHLRPQ